MTPDYDYIIGFDFGHGETSVAMVDAGKVSEKDGTVPVEDVYICEHSREPKITSLVGYDAEGKTEVDIDIYDFKCFEHVESYFKGPLVGSAEFKAIDDTQRRHFRDFVRTVFDRVTTNPRNVRLIGKRVRYYAACPSGWNKEQQETYFSFLRDECSVPVDGIIEESRAAHVTARRKLHERNPELAGQARRIAVLDLGSSTLDITLHTDRTYTDGYEIGASLIEEELLKHFLRENSEFRTHYEEYLALNPAGRDEILLFLRYAKENYFNKQKKYPDRDVDLVCSISWPDLSQDEVDGISTLRIKGSELTALFIGGAEAPKGSYVEKLRSHIGDFITKFGGADAVVLTGGASQMGFYRDIVLESFGLDDSACIVDDTPSYSISQGVATIGYMDMKCPVFDPADPEARLPEELQEIFERLPELINSDILSHYKAAYTDSLTQVVDLWKDKPGRKTLEELISGFDRAIGELQSRTESISRRINASVADNLRKKINKALQDTIRLYFGFDAPIQGFKIDYSFDFAVPEEDNRSLYERISRIIEEYINSRSFLHKWNGKTSLEKDRSDDRKLLEELPAVVKTFIGKWYGRYRIGDTIGEEVADCRDRLRKFYASTIRNITCQI